MLKWLIILKWHNSCIVSSDSNDSDSCNGPSYKNGFKGPIIMTVMTKMAAMPISTAVITALAIMVIIV